jgi:uncharacterized membrane protein HdeD (DUF308 family)
VLVMVLWIAAWAIITGILEVAAAIRYRRELQREWILVLSGILLVAVALRLRTGRLVTA